MLIQFADLKGKREQCLCFTIIEYFNPKKDDIMPGMMIVIGICLIISGLGKLTTTLFGNPIHSEITILNPTLVFLGLGCLVGGIVG